MDWYRWFPTLFENDTLLLDPYQDGCYRRLIDHYMKTRAPLPDPTDAWARIIGISIPDWQAKGADAVIPYFRKTKTGWTNKRCDIELNRQDRTTRVLSENGKNGAKKREENKKVKSTQKQRDTKRGLSGAYAGLEGGLSRGEVEVEVEVEIEEEAKGEIGNDDLVSHLCKVAQVRQRVDGTDDILVARWISQFPANFMTDTIKRQIVEFEDKGRQLPKALKYYDGILRDAYAAQQAASTETPPPAGALNGSHRQHPPRSNKASRTLDILHRYYDQQDE